MAATTTEFTPIQLYKDSAKVANASTACLSTGMYSTQGLPGAISLTTCGDVVRIPFERSDGLMAIEMAMYGVTASTAVYPAIALRIPPSTDKRKFQGPITGIGTSTAETGWAVVQSTAVMSGSSTIVQTYVFGPFESAEYGHTMGGTSTNSIDAGQMFLECMFGHTTKAAGTWLSLSTNNTLGGSMNIRAFELPKP
jgi:hypothetical protein